MMSRRIQVFTLDFFSLCEFISAFSILDFRSFSVKISELKEENCFAARGISAFCVNLVTNLSYGWHVGCKALDWFWLC